MQALCEPLKDIGKWGKIQEKNPKNQNQKKTPQAHSLLLWRLRQVEEAGINHITILMKVLYNYKQIRYFMESSSVSITTKQPGFDWVWGRGERKALSKFESREA